MAPPRPRAVVVGSLSLFAVLFVLLTFQLSASATSASAGHKKPAAKSRPAPVESQTDAEPGPEEAAGEYTEPEAGYEYEGEEPAYGYAEPEYGYAEPEYAEPEPEYEFAEPEEVPPVVTSSS